MLEQLLDHHQGHGADEDTQDVKTSKFTALQYITNANDSSKSALDDSGQKWKHTTAQFELNRKFVRAHNPDDESMTAGPGINDKIVAILEKKV